MEKAMKWFDRSFSFDLPSWMTPNVVERLRGTPARAEDMLRDVPPDVLIDRIGGGWSMQENLGHVLDLEPLWLGRVDDIMEGAPRLRDADLTNRKTHEANHNAQSVEDLLTAFRTARQHLVDRLDALAPSDGERTAIHPRLEQPMRLLDLLFFVAEHDDHHLAQITRLKRVVQDA